MSTNGAGTAGLPERLGDKVAIAIVVILALFFAAGYIVPLF
ncbi:MAG TPA: hypothetical protein VFL51_07180 [Pseudolabrys sp.]|nr:hypothetical protein [Pseudolabrys sp.]